MRTPSLPPGTGFAPAAALLLALTASASADPAWWSDPATSIWTASPQNTENWAPVNVGQLKNVAVKAKTYLDIRLAGFGGAGPAVNAACAFTNAQNWAPANVGQLKNVTKAFYDRLGGVAYNWQNPAATGTLPSQPYPWTGMTNPGNSAPANLGQLKLLFNFEIGSALLADTDGDQMLDGWEVAWFGGTAVKNGAIDSDTDGLTDREEFLLGGSPLAPGLDISSRRLDIYNFSTF